MTFRTSLRTRLERTVMILLKTVDWPDTVKATIASKASVPPRICGLPKFFKEGCPLHPRVNMIISPTYNVSKYLSGLLKPFLVHTEAHVKISAALVHVMDATMLAPWLV